MKLLLVICLLTMGELRAVLAQTPLPSCHALIDFSDDDGLDATVDVDKDNDGLIEICDLEGLDEIRYQLDGSGYKTSSDDEEIAITTGCPSDGCIGYELTKDLDFNDDASYRTITNQVAWTSGLRWPRIGDQPNPFTARFEGNGHTIASLIIRQTNREAGLFGRTADSSKIANLGLLNVNVTGLSEVGGLVGRNNGSIMNSYVTGSVSGISTTIGGLVGRNSGPITNSHATVSASGPSSVGGLVGWNSVGGTITNSYTAGSVLQTANNNIGGIEGSGGLVGRNSGSITNSYTTVSVLGPPMGTSNIGGLVGQNNAMITNSYWSSDSTSVGGFNVPTDAGKTAEQLKSPTMAAGIYDSWNTEIWDFGTSDQFPVLKDADGNLLPDQGTGLRELKVSTSDTELSPAFGVSTTHYVITFFSTATTYSIVLRLSAYSPDATISVTKQGEPTNYFSVAGGRGESDPITVDASTVLDIIVSEANANTTYNIVVMSEQVNLPSCLSSIEFIDDNDGFTPAVDIDKDGDGLIEVCDLEGLNEIRYQIDGTGYKTSPDAEAITIGCPADGCNGYELTKSMDFTTASSYREGDINTEWTTGVGWQPIGDFSVAFNTTFMASTKTLTISNLMIDRDDEWGVGLFGVSFGRIADIHLTDVSVRGYSVVGGLVGSNQGQITDSSVSGVVESISAWVGGLVGTNVGNGAIADSHAYADVSGYSWVGGLVGYNFGSLTYSSALSNVRGRHFSGGLVGLSHGPISNSYSGSSVESAFYGGGLVGYNDSYSGDNRGSVLNNVYATGSVTGGTYIGGLVGYNDSDINNGYAVGRVIGSGGLGGLVGINDDEGVIVNSFWDIETSGQTISDGGTSATTAQLQAPIAPGNTTGMVYYRWSDSTWSFGSQTEYPILRDEDGNNLPMPVALDGALALSGLQLKDSILEPPFDPLITEYEIFDIADDGMQIMATANSTSATVAIGLGSPTMSMRSQVSLTVQSADLMNDDLIVRLTEAGRTTKEYTITLPAQPTLVSGVQCDEMNRVDSDGDGLIEICDIEGLYAMRYRLDGSAYKASSAAAELVAGCPESGCSGYELVRDLDFGNSDHYRDSGNQAIWTVDDFSDAADKGWRPIGDFAEPFNAIFKANGYTISGLQMNRADSANGRDQAGFFGYIGSHARLDGVGLLEVDIRGRFSVGGLVGWSDEGTIINSFVEGSVAGSQAGGLLDSSWIGGIAGTNNGAIVNSYAQANVFGHTMIGGLVGSATRDSRIKNSYAEGVVVTGINYVGGLAGFNQGRLEDCYARVTISGIFSLAGLVALNDDEGVIENCYASVGEDSFGIINGLVSDNQGVVNQSYWQENVNISDNGVGQAQDLLQVTSLLGWSSDNWDFTAGEYPGVKYTTGDDEDNPACETPPPDSELPNCGALLPEQRFDLERIELLGTSLSPDFDIAIDEYTANVAAGTTNVKVVVHANRRDTPTTINGKIAPANVVNVVELAEVGDTQIAVVDEEQARTYTITVIKIALPSCLAAIGFLDNDGIDQAIDVDKDNDGLIEICDLEGLDEIRYQPDGTGYTTSTNAMKITTGCPVDGCRGYELTKSLDFTDNASYRLTTNKDRWTTGAGWQPIGDFAVAFSTTFMASTKTLTISNLMINRDSEFNLGLFGVSFGRIADIHLTDVSVRGYSVVGGLVGSNQGQITDSSVSGVVESISAWVGGLVGTNVGNGAIADSHAYADVSGYSWVGGLVGYNFGSLTYSSALSNVRGRHFSGGLVGLSHGPISNSYAGSSVESAFYGGGLVGYNDSYTGDNRGSVLNNVYATGSVTGGTYIGGLVGYNDSDINNGYAVGRVIGSGGLGGLVGINDDEGVIANSFWDIETSGQTISDGGTSATTAQLQAPIAPGNTTATVYYRWSDSTWSFGSQTEYPILRDEDGNNLPMPVALDGALALSGLQLKDSILEPPFDPLITEYEIFDIADDGMQIMATANSTSATVAIGLGSPTMSMRSQVSLPVQSTDLMNDDLIVRLTEAGRTTKEYTITLPAQPTLVSGVQCDEMNRVDSDGDGLIEICDIEGLYAMRYRLDGSAYKASSAAAELVAGCPESGCSGYELVRDLDFGNSDHYRDSGNQAIWTVDDFSDAADKGWRPIGDFAEPFNAIFKANGYTISGLQMNRADSANGRDQAGFFGYIGSHARLDGVGLLEVDVRGRFSVGGLVGWSDEGTIINSFVEGSVAGSQAGGLLDSSWIGGIAGTNNGAIVNSYAQANVFGHTMIGGLVGSATRDSRIKNSYAEGVVVTGTNYVGGLAGFNQGRFEDCYARVAIRGIFSLAGLVALNDDEGVIENCYAAVGEDSFGIINGLVNDNQGVVNQSYWQENVNISDNGVGQAQDLLQVTSLLGWSSDNWDFTAGEYPGVKYTTGDDEDSPACETPPPDSELPNCGALLPEQRFDLERIALIGTRLSPDFDIAIDEYTAGVTAGTTNVRVIVHANRRDTSITINGNATSASVVNVVKLAEVGNTQITVVNQNRARTYTITVIKITLPPCHASIEFSDDDGIDQAIDVDKDNDGLIEICDLEGLDEIRHQSDGTGYKTSPDADAITIGCPSDGCKGYELTKSLDFTDNNSYRLAASKGKWMMGEGWPPIASFRSIFDGNNHTIANLYINGMGIGLGLFSFSFAQSQIRNVNLSDVDINGSGLTGGLIGLNGGLIVNARMTGTVSVTGDSVGGLVGNNGSGGIIQDSSASGTIIGNRNVGGLVGASSSIIRGSFASGTVRGNNNVGGLVGTLTQGSGQVAVINSHANSVVKGTTGTGGLIGSSEGFIISSHASGAVSGHSDVGGLVGHNDTDTNRAFNSIGRIFNSYATGPTTGTSNVGGLIGINEGIIANTYATGPTTGTSDVGGLVGLLKGGSLALENEDMTMTPSEGGTIENSYATGKVSATVDDNQSIGGMVGATTGTVTITASYWDTDTSGQDASAAGVGRTTVQLQEPTAAGSTLTEVYYNWNPDYPRRADWDFGDDMSYPALRYGVSPDEDVAACSDGPDAMLPQCSLLLPNQSGRDRGLDFVFFLSDIDNLSIEREPSFSPLVKQYEVLFVTRNAIRLRPFAVNSNNATIKVTRDGENPERDYFAGMNSGDTSIEIPFSDTTTTLIIMVTETTDSFEAENVYRFEITKVLPPVLSEVVVFENGEMDTNDTVDEGSQITLGFTIDNASGDHRYEVRINGESTEPVAQSTSSITIELPTDLISGDAQSLNVNLELIVEGFLLDVPIITSLTKVLTVRKIDNGSPDIEAEVNGGDLSVFIGSDPDGDGTTSYQWQRLNYEAGTPRWINLDSQTGSTFSESLGVNPDVNPAGSLRYRVEVTYIDAQDYETVELIPFVYRVEADDNENGLIEIYYLEDLDAIRYQLDGSGYRGSPSADKVDGGCPGGGCNGYELARSLNFNDDASYVSTSNKVLWTTGAGWQPVGDPASPFDAVLSASNAGLTISNLYINRPDEDYVGLFGMSNGRIEGLDLRGVNIEGRFIVGGIAGVSLGPSLILNTSVDGTVSGSDTWIGGLAGAHYGSIINSHARGEVIGDTSVGGLAGYAFGPITNSYAHSNIKSQAYSGGLVGHHQGQQGITNSYAAGSVESVFYVGGLVGYNDGGTIANAYALGDVVGGSNVGELVGYNDGGMISMTYALGDTVGAYHVDGLVGGQNGGSISDSYNAAQLGANLASSNWSADNWNADGVNPPSLKYGGSASGDDAGQRRDSYGYTVCGGDNMPSCGNTIPGQPNREDAAVGRLLALSELILSVGTLEPPFNPSVDEYEIFDISGDLMNTLMNTTVTAVANNSSATVSIGLGNQTISMNSQTSLRVQLNNLRNNSIVVALTASGQTTKTYKITLPVQPNLTNARCDSENRDVDNDGLIEICNIEGLYAMRYPEALSTSVCGENNNETCTGYELENDLDFDADASYRTLTNKAIFSEGRGWRPIGTLALPFNAIFNANGHTIANLRIDRVHRDYVGLFAHTGPNAELEDIRLVDAHVQGRSVVGALVGDNANGTIISSYTRNAMTTTMVIGGGIRVGGLIGDHKGIVEHGSYTSGVVQGNRSVGGLVGYFSRLNSGENPSDHGIINSYAESTVQGRTFTGGLVGTNVNRIVNSYAIGDVASIFYAGGLAGFNGGITTNTYASGDVSGSEIVGGLVADNRFPGSITNSYALGMVSGQRTVGALVGNNSGTISNSYGVGHPMFAGIRLEEGTITNSRVVSPETLQMPIDEWDAQNAWSFENGKYPALRYATSEGCERESSCGQLLGGQYPELASLTIVEPETARLSLQSELSYLLSIAEDITQIMLIATVDDTNTTISYSINSTDFTTVASGVSFTVDPLPTTAVIIRLEPSDTSLRSVDYVVQIKRIQRIRVLLQVRVFLEGLLREISP